MNQHDIHEIISQISQSLDCPECKARILPNNIEITDIIGDDCMFDVVCDRCNTEMTLSAHIEKTTAEEAMTHNMSSQIMHDNIVDHPVSMEEVRMMKKELANFCGSFIETFCR
jgi:protein-arginine kinase activator protein McsA